MVGGYRTLGDSNGGTYNWDSTRGLRVVMNHGGGGYIPGTYTNVPIIGGGGTGALCTVVVTANGSLQTATLGSAGAGYQINEVNVRHALRGGSGGLVNVTTNGTTGAITALSISPVRGEGYTNGTVAVYDQVNAILGGTAVITTGGTVSSITITNHGTGYSGIAQLDLSGAWETPGAGLDVFFVSDDRGFSQINRTGQVGTGRWIRSPAKLLDVDELGAYGDGVSRTFASLGLSLAQAQAEFPFVTATTQEYDWAVIQLALKICGSNEIYLPGTEYRVNWPMVWRRQGDTQGLRMHGNGMYGTKIKVASITGSTEPVLMIDGASLSPYDFAWGTRLSDFMIEGAGIGVGNAIDAIQILGQWCWEIERVSIKAMSGSGIVYPPRPDIYPNPDGLSSAKSFIRACEITRNGGHGIDLASNISVSHVMIDGNVITLNDKIGIRATGAGMIITNNSPAFNGSATYKAADPLNLGGGNILIEASPYFPRPALIYNNEIDGGYAYNLWVKAGANIRTMFNRFNSNDAGEHDEYLRPPVQYKIGWERNTTRTTGGSANSVARNIISEQDAFRSNFGAKTPPDSCVCYHIDAGTRVNSEHVPTDANAYAHVTDVVIRNPDIVNNDVGTILASKAGGARVSARLNVSGAVAALTIIDAGEGYDAATTTVSITPPWGMTQETYDGIPDNGGSISALDGTIIIFDKARGVTRKYNNTGAAIAGGLHAPNTWRDYTVVANDQVGISSGVSNPVFDSQGRLTGITLTTNGLGYTHNPDDNDPRRLVKPTIIIKPDEFYGLTGGSTAGDRVSITVNNHDVWSGSITDHMTRRSNIATVCTANTYRPIVFTSETSTDKNSLNTWSTSAPLDTLTIDRTGTYVFNAAITLASLTAGTVVQLNWSYGGVSIKETYHHAAGLTRQTFESTVTYPVAAGNTIQIQVRHNDSANRSTDITSTTWNTFSYMMLR